VQIYLFWQVENFISNNEIIMSHWQELQYQCSGTHDTPTQSSVVDGYNDVDSCLLGIDDVWLLLGGFAIC